MTPFSDDKDIVSIVNFCLNIYKLQLEVPKSAPSRIVPVDFQSDGADAVYELHVKRGTKWASRRMAIAKLGGESGSKSKCFKVIYDDLLVIKIPPSPIRDFSEYISSIRAESRIAIRLAPKIEFVAPGVTALLKKIRIFSSGLYIKPSELEKKYVRWLEQNRAFQEYLKIGDSFAFFMDLSKHSFLSYVVDRMHDNSMFRHKIREEVAESIGLLWDILGFEGKYGPENLSICFDMNKVYSDYATNISVLLRQYALSVSAYERQKWFSIYLAEKKVREEENMPHSGFVADLNRLLGKIVRENDEEVAAYRRVVWNYVTQKTFSQNRPRLSGLVTNILRLLASLNESGIAIRDLKPDNLFVVGDTELSAEDYSLGLIDFETAVEFKRDGTDLKKIEQPLLGGTPSYATPSHLFKNEVLISVFGDLPRILHFQDWHAALGMIYNAITGEWLFENTRKYLSRIPSAMRQAAEKKKPIVKVFRKSSQIFWSSAVSEFKEKLTEKKNLLKAVEVMIPEEFQIIVWKNIVREKENISRKIQDYIVSQVIFRKKDTRKNLIQCSLEDTVRYREKWEKGVGLPKTSPGVRKKIITLLKHLEELKLRAEKQRQWLKLLGSADPRMSAYQLLKLMFSIVMSSMYKEEWGGLSESYASEFGAETYDSSETTILYENTILYED